MIDLVFSAGVRPGDELARDAGLPVGDRGGVLVGRDCRTEDDPAVYAIGECACIDRRVWGLLAPAYAMAAAAAGSIACGSDAFAATPDALEALILPDTVPVEVRDGPVRLLVEPTG